MEAVVVLLLAKVEGAKKFGQADQLGALFGSRGDPVDCRRKILFRVGRHRHLDEGDWQARGALFGHAGISAQRDGRGENFGKDDGISN
jgi:hypothetical protein